MSDVQPAVGAPGIDIIREHRARWLLVFPRRSIVTALDCLCLRCWRLQEHETARDVPASMKKRER